MLANIIRNRKKTAIGGGGGGIVTDGDPFYSAVSLLLPMDGTNGSTTFTDSGPSALTVTAAANAQISTTQVKYGSASGYFDGTGDSLTIPANTALALGAGDYTIEGWFYSLTSGTSLRGMIDFRTAATGTNGLMLRENDGGFLVYLNSATLLSTTTGRVANQWQHVALVRKGTTVTLYVDGVSRATATSSTTLTDNILRISGFVDTQSSVYTYNGYMDDIRISLFARYVSTFTPPTAALPTTASSTVADPYYGYTSLLLHMDGTNASTNFVDSGPSALTLTSVGSAQISTTQSKFGGASGYYNGSTGYLSLTGNSSFQFGTGDFTVEMWVYISANAANQQTFLDTRGTATATPFTFGIYQSKLAFYDGTMRQSSATVTTGQWYHFAACRSGGTLRLFIDGISYYSASNTTNFTTGANSIYIGRGFDSAAYYTNGFIDDLRVTKYARYTSAFAPPTQALPEYATGNDRYFSNTSLLLHMDGANGSTTFTDNSANVLAVTAVGSPTTSTTQLKFGTSAAAVGGTNYLTLPNNSSLFDFGLGDFTIEFWFYYSSSQSGQIQVAVRSANQSGSLSPWLLDKKSGTNYMGFSWTSDGASWVLNEKVGTVAMTPNAWNHIAIVRRSGTFYSYINGTQDWSDSTSSTSAIQAGGDILAIGRWPKYANSPGTYYIDDFRITKGVARYTANFTPEITAFPNA